MHLAAIVVGALLVIGVFTDAFLTTLAPSSGPGPLSGRLLGALWRLLLGVRRRRGSTTLSLAGAVLLLATVLIWVLLLWTEWSLLFWGADTVVNSTTGRPADTAEVVYFAGFTLFTLGTGDFGASASAWSIVSVVATFSGLFLVTLAITYLLAVLSAVVQRRALAVRIRGLGADATRIVTRAWQGGGFTSMSQQQLIGLTPDLVTGAEQHLAYPVLHYFHARERDRAASQAIVDLDEALLLMTVATRPEERPDPSVTEPLRHAIDRYLDTVGAVAWSPDADPPPAPSLDPLVAEGIPLVEAGEFERALEDRTSRRRALHRLLRSDGWEWTGR